MLLAAAVVAIVTQEPTFLKASASAKAPNNATLWRGDVLEVRGNRLGYLQVYNYRRERAGYVLESRVRQCPLDTTTPGGALSPRCSYASAVASRPRGVRLRKPSWMRNGS